MVSYYIYGRQNGFINYNPGYSQEDVDRFFLKMTPYSKDGLDYRQDQESEKQNLPEKIFFYEVTSKANGRCAIFGRSSFVRANTTKVSGDRDTVFSFQYLRNGEDREEINENPAILYDLPFPSNMDQVCVEKDPGMPLNAGNSLLRPEKFLENCDKNKCVQEKYTPEELLDVFSLTGEKLSEFLYTFLQLNVRERVYLLLPDNTKASSDMAFALICRVLELLPPILVSRTGFVTYVNRVESSSADYVPFEIRHMFLANTQENRFVCQRTRSAFVFADGYGTGIRIPAEMQEIAECFRTAFLDGSSNQRLQDLWDCLDSYLREDASIPISPVEYQALDRFGMNRRMLEEPNGAEKLPAEEDVWKNIDLLRKMRKERAALWLPKLSEDVTEFVKKLIDEDLVCQRGQYDRLLAEYRDYPELGEDESITQYFSRKVIDNASFEAMIKILEPCQPLKRAVAENHADDLVKMMQSGRLPETFYNTVFELYHTSEIMRETIVSFFERKITDTDSYFRYQRRITDPGQSGNGYTEIWKDIDKKLFSEKEELAAELAKQMIEDCFASPEYSQTPDTLMRAFWLVMGRLKGLNESILFNEDFYRDVSRNLDSFFETWNEPENVCQLLKDSEAQIEQLKPPSAYRSLFENISGNYLRKFTDKICDSCRNPEIVKDWPFLSPDDSILQEVRDKYEKRTGSLESLDVMIRSSSVMEIVDYFKDDKNRMILSQAAQSDKAGVYVSEILKKLEDEVTGHGIKNAAKDQYEELCLLLLLVFPCCTKDVCVYVLDSAYGGIASLCSIAKALHNPMQRPAGFPVTAEMRERYKDDLAEAFRQFFSIHHATRANKKEIKDNRNYLIAKIGLKESEVDNFVRRS